MSREIVAGSRWFGSHCALSIGWTSVHFVSQHHRWSLSSSDCLSALTCLFARTLLGVTWINIFVFNFALFYSWFPFILSFALYILSPFPCIPISFLVHSVIKEKLWSETTRVSREWKRSRSLVLSVFQGELKKDAASMETKVRLVLLFQGECRFAVA